ncbi:MAG: hypothetical protein QM642_03780 [Edaphocola sp.]
MKFTCLLAFLTLGSATVFAQENNGEAATKTKKFTAHVGIGSALYSKQVSLTDAYVNNGYTGVGNTNLLQYKVKPFNPAVTASIRYKPGKVGVGLFCSVASLTVEKNVTQAGTGDFINNVSKTAMPHTIGILPTLSYDFVRSDKFVVYGGLLAGGSLCFNNNNGMPYSQSKSLKFAPTFGADVGVGYTLSANVSLQLNISPTYTVIKAENSSNEKKNANFLQVPATIGLGFRF